MPGPLGITAVLFASAACFLFSWLVPLFIRWDQRRLERIAREEREARLRHARAVVDIYVQSCLQRPPWSEIKSTPEPCHV